MFKALVNLLLFDLKTQIFQQTIINQILRIRKMSEQSQMQLHKKNKNYRQAYHEFHSQRQQTNHSFDIYSANSLRTYKQSPSSYISSIEFHINNPITQIIRQFKKMLRQKGYKCIEIFPNQLYLAKLGFMDKVKKLFACIEPPKYILSIRTHQYRSVRTVSLKRLFNIKSVDSSALYSNQIQYLLSYLSSSPKLNKPLTNEQISQLDNQYKQDFYSLDATSNYMFSKMLVDSNYSIGKRITSIINRFRDNKKVEQNKFSDLIWLNCAITQITDEMLEGFNCSRKQLYEILGYCRKSIENYFYSSVQQWRAQLTTKQSTTNINVPQKDQPTSVKPFNTEQQSPSKQKFNYEYFHTLYPISLKQLNLLLKSQISIEIFEKFYLFIEFTKMETQNNKVSDEVEGQFLEWVKNQYNERLLMKIKCIKAAGFVDKFCQQFVRDLKFQM